MLTNNPGPSKALLVLPWRRVQNANAISSPMTWGFPSITAFTGLMIALQRRLGRSAGIDFYRVGVICHRFEAQVSRGGYVRSFCLTRNPIRADGETAAIVEEGRAHLDITLVFDVELASEHISPAERTQLAERIGDLLAGMRVAGGSVMPPLPGETRSAAQPELWLKPIDAEERRVGFRRLRRRWLPGFALVSRDDLLEDHLAQMRAQWPQATELDAWLDFSRLNYRAQLHTVADKETGEPTQKVGWRADRRPGWIVPIPVGFAALSGPHPPGSVSGVRDPNVPFCFVESVYSLGQWISPHRLVEPDDLMWEPTHDLDTGLYRCFNEYRASGSPQ